jgi:hypothetical protein
MTDVPGPSGPGPDRPAERWSAAPAAPRNGMGTAALVVGVVALVLALFLLGLPLGILAIVLGILGLRRASRGEATNRGMAIGGIVTGALGVLLAGALIAAGVAFFIENDEEIDDLNECLEQADSDAERDRCADRFRESIEDQVD